MKYEKTISDYNRNRTVIFIQCQREQKKVLKFGKQLDNYWKNEL